MNLFKKEIKTSVCQLAKLQSIIQISLKSINLKGVMLLLLLSLLRLLLLLFSTPSHKV